MNSLLLFYSSYGDEQGLTELAAKAEQLGKYNVAFEAYYLLAQVDNCLNVLVKSKRMAEAAIFARAYCPSRLSEVIPKWSGMLKEQNFPFFIISIMSSVLIPSTHAITLGSSFFWSLFNRFFWLIFYGKCKKLKCKNYQVESL